MIWISFLGFLIIINQEDVVFYDALSEKDVSYKYNENELSNDLIETKLSKDEFLFDFHAHTTKSSGELTPEDAVLYYQKRGIYGVAFSDHNTLDGSIAAQEFVEKNNINFLVLMSEEWSVVHNVHMSVFGFTEEIDENKFDEYSIEDKIKYIKQKGGYIIVNHYNVEINQEGKIGVPFTLEQLRDWGVDGFEIINKGVLLPTEIREFCLENNLICLGGSDFHLKEKEIRGFIRLKLDDPKNKSIDNIFRNLRRNEHEIILISRYKKIEYLMSNLNIDNFEFFLSKFLEINIILYILCFIYSNGLLFSIVLIFKKLKSLELNFQNNFSLTYIVFKRKLRGKRFFIKRVI
ncbi:MAG: PHP domain-containing protein [Promethearchaeota archaeon]